MAKRIGGEKSEKIYHTQKFEIVLDTAQLSVLLQVSDVLKQVYNAALSERQGAFETHVAPVLGLIRDAKKALADKEENFIIDGRQMSPKEAIRELSLRYNNIPTLFDQINQLTKKRKDPIFAAVPRNWQEETLDRLHGAYASFIALRKNGDMDARPPRERENGFFQKIPGRKGFKVVKQKIVLSCNETTFSFPIPDYQWDRILEAVLARFMQDSGKILGDELNKLSARKKIDFLCTQQEWSIQGVEKTLASIIKKFELYRDEPNLAKPGRFWVSITYELPAPETVPFDPSKATFVTLGASSMGVISPRGEEVISIWRSDKHWEPQIGLVKNRMKKRTKGSRGWNKLQSAKRIMEEKGSRQRLQNEREIVAHLLEKYGKNFVVTDMVVRSKEGKLADGKNPHRGGVLGLNWQAQNTGSLSRLCLLLEQKTREIGGSVHTHKLILKERPLAKGADVKIWMARKLKDSFLSQHKSS